MMKKQILVMLAAMCMMSLFAAGASANTTIGIGDGSGYVTMPVSVTGAEGVGSVDVTLYFDPAVVTVSDVKDSGMDSMFANLENVGDGYVRIGAYQTNSGGLYDEFIIANVVLEPVSYYESCELGITVTTFKDSTPAGNVMDYIVSNGTYTAERDGDNGDDDDWYDDGDDGDNGNVTPTATPTTTPTTTPTASPTKTLPDDDPIDDVVSKWGFLAVFVIAGILLIAYLVLRKKGDE